MNIFTRLTKSFARLVNSEKDLWNNQYKTGQWEILKSPVEEERFKALVDLTNGYVHQGAVLEVGCGEGLLLPKLESTYNYFLGIDLSDVALGKAERYLNGNTEFQCVNMERFVPDRLFDVIIFNECLNYSKRPIQLLLKYSEFLTDSGVLATSIYENKETIKIVNRIREEFSCLTSKVTVNERGVWHCDVFKKRQAV